MEKSPLSRPAMIALCAALILIWGSAFNFVGVAVDHISPFWLTAWRLLVGATVLTLYALITGHRFPTFRDPRWIWYSVLGMTGAVIPFLLMAKGQLSVDSGLTAVIVGAMPLITIVLAHFFTDEKLTLFKVFGFFIGFLGVAVLFMPDQFGLGLTGNWKSQLIILCGAFCYAGTTVAAKRAPKTPAPVGSAIMMIAASIAGLTAALILDPGGHVPNAPALTMILLLGIGSTSVGTILYLFFIDRVGPSSMARLNYFPPVLSVIIGVWFLSEPFTWKLIVAFIVIIIGVMVSRISSPSERRMGSIRPDRGRPRPPIPAVRPDRD
ncbi:DMT family transporter [Algimonas arctica]|nr:EamA family transporter [Algimonas arctica]